MNVRVHVCCPGCGARQALAERRSECRTCGKVLRIRRLLPRRRFAARGIRALALLLAGYALAWWTAPGPEPLAASPPSPAYVAPAPREWDVGADALADDERFETVTTAAPFVLMLERAEGIDLGRGERYAGVLRELTARFMAMFEMPMRFGEIAEPLPVVVLNDGPAGRYEYASRRTVMTDDPREWRRVLAHEATHQIVDAYMRRSGARVSPWIQEGLAMLFETGADPVVINRARRAGFRPVPLAELLSIEPGDFFERGVDWARDAYAASWGLTYFLLMKHRALFHTLFRLELEGAGGAAAFEREVRRAVGGTLDSFEAEWLQFMHSLP